MTARPTGGLVDERAVELGDELEDLHRTLIVDRGGNSADHHEPLELFVRHHANGAAGAGFTAMLLCTADSWWRASARRADGRSAIRPRRCPAGAPGWVSSGPLPRLRRVDQLGVRLPGDRDQWS
ncbi:MAG TPA: hypothetical protein VM324_01915 [Egibacteraceae bacterium]|nr:hypothetical protein [Egibacteraceae bacterium]